MNCCTDEQDMGMSYVELSVYGRLRKPGILLMPLASFLLLVCSGITYHKYVYNIL